MDARIAKIIAVGLLDLGHLLFLRPRAERQQIMQTIAELNDEELTRRQFETGMIYP